MNISKLFRKPMTDEEVREFFNVTIDKKFDDEIESVLEELKYGPHIDDPTYRTSIDNLNLLISAKDNYKKASTKEEKVEAKSKYRTASNGIDWNIILPVLIKAGLSLGVLMFWLALERENILPQRLVNWTTNLLLPR